MKLDRDMEIVEGLPVLYIRSLSAVVCSDLHLGYEGVYASKGVFMPKANLKKIKDMLREAVRKTGAENVIVVGDIKNESSEVHLEELNEFKDFISFLRDDMKLKGISLIKSNNDNFVDKLKHELNFEVYAQEAVINDYTFFHGEEIPKNAAGKVLVMGHLHPAIAIYDNAGEREKLKCFLYGKTSDGRRIVVLPAMNFFSEGIYVNQDEVGGVAPVFKELVNIDMMKALCLGKGEILDLGDVKKLRIAGRY